MSDDTPKPRRGGPRPGRTSDATTTLGGVRVTIGELEAYGAAAEAQGASRADWIRDTLNRAARRVLRSSR